MLSKHKSLLVNKEYMLGDIFKESEIYEVKEVIAKQ